MMVPANLNV